MFLVALSTEGDAHIFLPARSIRHEPINRERLRLVVKRQAAFGSNSSKADLTPTNLGWIAAGAISALLSAALADRLH
jgi:hypothetical protein